MRNRFRPLCLQLLHRVVQEEVDQDSIDRHAGVPAQDLTADELDAPDATAAQLDFPRMSALDRPQLPDVVVEGRAVVDAAEGVEHLRDAVIYAGSVWGGKERGSVGPGGADLRRR